jgi:hypothetical protein
MTGMKRQKMTKKKKQKATTEVTQQVRNTLLQDRETDSTPPNVGGHDKSMF